MVPNHHCGGIGESARKNLWTWTVKASISSCLFWDVWNFRNSCQAFQTWEREKNDSIIWKSVAFLRHSSLPESSDSPKPLVHCCLQNTALAPEQAHCPRGMYVTLEPRGWWYRPVFLEVFFLGFFKINFSWLIYFSDCSFPAIFSRLSPWPLKYFADCRSAP